METGSAMAVGKVEGGLLWSREGERREPEGDQRGQVGDQRVVLDPEVLERPLRRKYTAEYKLRALHEADRCSRPGELGALLRREGLYSFHLTTWRRQRKKRGGIRGAVSKEKGQEGQGGR